jgi:xanthosine utilization system XapX-like protein
MTAFEFGAGIALVGFVISLLVIRAPRLPIQAENDLDTRGAETSTS